MILESKGLTTRKYFLLPFILSEGEIVVINLLGGPNFQPAKTHLRQIFCGDLVEETVCMSVALKAVEDYVEPCWRRLLWMVTVGEYLQEYANARSEYAVKIYHIYDWITPKTKLNRLPGTPKKQLSLFAALSHSNNIVFDLLGQDPKGAEETYGFVKMNVKKGGSAILLDWTDDMKNDCTRFVKAEWF